jgi:hypothetical protein
MEGKLKHLEFIQAAIARMATNSFLFKGWAVTIAAGLSAFATVNSKVGLLALALISTMMFWGLDGYYLWLEKCFIDLYSNVAVRSEASIDFSMTIDKSQPLRRWIGACIRPHSFIFYGAIIVIDVIGIFILGASNASK